MDTYNDYFWYRWHEFDHVEPPDFKPPCDEPEHESNVILTVESVSPP